MKELTSYVFSFENLIQDNFLYVCRQDGVYLETVPAETLRLFPLTSAPLRKIADSLHLEKHSLKDAKNCSKDLPFTINRTTGKISGSSLQFRRHRNRAAEPQPRTVPKSPGILRESAKGPCSERRIRETEGMPCGHSPFSARNNRSSECASHT